LGTSSFPLRGRQPGWDQCSYGYHSDDGRLFHGSGLRSKPFGPRYTVGDVVGCGLCIGTRQIFYTLNGRFLGVAFVANPKHTSLHPLVGLDSHASVHLNFGQRPFLFDTQTLPVAMRARPPTDPPPSGLTQRLAHVLGRL